MDEFYFPNFENLDNSINQSRLKQIYNIYYKYSGGQLSEKKIETDKEISDKDISDKEISDKEIVIIIKSTKGLYCAFLDEEK
jgi:hypothetical protein